GLISPQEHGFAQRYAKVEAKDCTQDSSQRGFLAERRIEESTVPPSEMPSRSMSLSFMRTT
ncbi:MAG: hypothetical protein WBW37_18855, partial [Methyloceanibacter sp.]